MDWHFFGWCTLDCEVRRDRNMMFTLLWCRGEVKETYKNSEVCVLSNLLHCVESVLNKSVSCWCYNTMICRRGSCGQDRLYLEQCERRSVGDWAMQQGNWAHSENTVQHICGEIFRHVLRWHAVFMWPANTPLLADTRNISQEDETFFTLTRRGEDQHLDLRGRGRSC